ncbi:hypothetical protein DMH02_018105 [Streptomyces sp. WAC 00631]|uniref:hypothetical protein n=1 Tax=unclassified Streptomyces TaxID=2593676 RepID=UPI000F7B23B3|nr:MULTISPECIES: hypothetical protein [unclassified Streptomyces]MCC5035074.1 hypothetical protein [Streptomyces sp. WAC 00631]MCC9741578.1 hypothetical protein [Streptomyces sp. MNU89]
MTALRLADTGEAADLAAFLARLIHYDRAAAVRLQTGGGVLAVFGRPAPFEVLAVRTARLADGPAGPSRESAPAPGPGGLDLTVSAGQLADALDAASGDAAGGADVGVPGSVTGPPWAGVLPPRGGWRQLPGLPGPEEIRAELAAAVAEFRRRDEALPEPHRTRAERDRIGREIWSRTLDGTGLPLRAAHAAQALGFLRPVPRRNGPVPAGRGGTGPAASATATATAVAPRTAPEQPLALLAAGDWLRLRTPYGSIAVRGTARPGLPLTPV